jgi:hypothetical protein
MARSLWSGTISFGHTTISAPGSLTSRTGGASSADPKRVARECLRRVVADACRLHVSVCLIGDDAT